MTVFSVGLVHSCLTGNISHFCTLCPRDCFHPSSHGCPGDVAVLNGIRACRSDPLFDRGDWGLCRCLRWQNVACDQSLASVAEFVPLTQGVCPGCVHRLGDSPRSFYEAALAQRAETA